MEQIPITFEIAGKKYSARFTAVHGAGQNVWHLMDNQNYYLGRLRRVNDKWVFDASDKSAELKQLADFFGDYLISWYG